MIAIKRAAEPEVLQKHKGKWTQAFVEERGQNPRARPRSERYAHANVKATLEAMSHHKCFYCERSTKDEKPEVDHFVEVAEKPELAFEWANLYLACCDCNSAKNRARHIPPQDCIDPCGEGVRPEEHLAFEDELIRAKNESATGLRTIQKYGLSRETLDLKRIRRLQSLRKVVDTLKDRMIESGRKTLTSEELSLLRSFAQPDAPFSLMCGCYLDHHGFR
ncbi:HNH endonuclease [Polyangium mundeleinium]|uniref:HNH endonuclease n=1 Tax=Polyangium mundeleinium TaxID=2995306 RepID=A0ABT5ETN7_9BACT|nr:HNH endonuclease [Polyangium mundeleinium]MDC0745189.1 HNH endonuclease [Polyangium mundeleinium]